MAGSINMVHWVTEENSIDLPSGQARSDKPGWDYVDVKAALAALPRKGFIKKPPNSTTVNIAYRSSPCCAKPLSSSKANRLRNEVKTTTTNYGGKEKLEFLGKRVKTNSSQSLKENENNNNNSSSNNNIKMPKIVSATTAGGTTTTDWRWPPQVNDMVVGLFEDGWYIGKALEIIAKGDRVKIKFMEDRNFKVTQRFWKWPRVNDIQVRSPPLLWFYGLTYRLILKARHLIF